MERDNASLLDIMILDYDGVNVKRVWEVVGSSIPDLLNQIKPLLPQEGEF